MNYKFLSKNGPTLAFVLFVVCVVICIVPILSGLTEFSELPAERQAYAEPSKIFLPGLYLTYGLLWVGVIVAIVLALLGIAAKEHDAGWAENTKAV